MAAVLSVGATALVTWFLAAVLLVGVTALTTWFLIMGRDSGSDEDRIERSDNPMCQDNPMSQEDECAVIVPDGQ